MDEQFPTFWGDTAPATDPPSLTFEYDQATGTCRDERTGITIAWGGGWGVQGQEQQEFCEIHANWEFRQTFLVVEVGRHCTFTPRNDGSGKYDTERWFDPGATVSLLPTHKAEFVRGTGPLPEHNRAVLRAGIACLYTEGGAWDVKVRM